MDAISIKLPQDFFLSWETDSVVHPEEWGHRMVPDPRDMAGLQGPTSERKRVGAWVPQRCVHSDVTHDLRRHFRLHLKKKRTQALPPLTRSSFKGPLDQKGTILFPVAQVRSQRSLTPLLSPIPHIQLTWSPVDFHLYICQICPLLPTSVANTLI